MIKRRGFFGGALAALAAPFGIDRAAAAEPKPDSLAGLTREAMERAARLEGLAYTLRLVDHTCPACGLTDRCAVNQYVSFLNDRFDLRCEACLYVWTVPTNDGDSTRFMPKCSECDRPASGVSDLLYHDTGSVVAGCLSCHRFGVVGSSEPWIHYPHETVRRIRDENDELFQVAKRDWVRRKAARIAAWTK